MILSRTPVTFFHTKDREGHEHWYQANLLSGTYRHMPTYEVMKWAKHVLSAQGVPWSDWPTVVDDPRSFGVLV